MKTSDKIKFWLRWFIVVIPINLFAIITCWFMYPLAYLMEGINNEFNPFWWWLDDEIEDENKNADFKKWLVGRNPKNFFVLYNWHCLRNRCWNLRELFKPKKAREHCAWNKEVILEVIKDDLKRDAEKISIYNKCLEKATYLWIDKLGNEGWLINSGVKISTKYSTIGECRYWYSALGQINYISTRAYEVKVPILGVYYNEYAIGATHERYIWVWKPKRKKSEQRS